MDQFYFCMFLGFDLSLAIQKGEKTRNYKSGCEMNKKEGGGDSGATCSTPQIQVFPHLALHSASVVTIIMCAVSGFSRAWNLWPIMASPHCMFPCVFSHSSPSNMAAT